MLDTDELARWQRLSATMLAHAAQDDPAAFAQVVALLDRACELLPAVAWSLRETSTQHGAGELGGYSWAELAEPLHVTRSAAAQRFAVTKAPTCPDGARVIRPADYRHYLAGH